MSVCALLLPIFFWDPYEPPIVETTLVVLAFIGWVGLLLRQIWAWWILIALHVFFLYGAINIASSLVFGKPESDIGLYLAVIAFWMALTVPVLWVLMTDRPGKWCSDSASSDSPSGG